jgi:hypothetical protein
VGTRSPSSTAGRAGDHGNGQGAVSGGLLSPLERLVALAPEQRLVIALAHFGEMTCADIAAELHVPEEVVARRIYHALHQLGDHQR